MSRDLTTLNETIRNLTVMSDALQYVRNKFKKEKQYTSQLLQSQEHLTNAIRELQLVDTHIKKTAAKDKIKKQAENLEAIEDWKKEEIKKLNEDYKIQSQVIKSHAKENLKAQSTDLLKREFQKQMKDINDKYNEAIGEEY